MLYKLPAFLFCPLLFIWSIVYGGIAGFIFKIMAVLENWRAINRQHIHLWKKYPLRSYRKYIDSMWANQFKGKPLELAEYDKIQLEIAHPEEPFPFIRLFLNSIFMIFIMPFVALSGLYYGPLYIYTTQITQYRLLFNNSRQEYNRE